MKLEVTAQNQWITYSRAEVARKQTSASVLIQPDLANGTIISVQVRLDDSDTWKTIQSVANADLTAGIYFVYNVTLQGSWQVRAGCATGAFGSGDTPEILLLIAPF